MTECKYPGCDRERERGSKCCSTEHEVKYEHLKADARDAQRSDEREARVEGKGVLEP